MAEAIEEPHVSRRASVTTIGNAYCAALSIPTPRIEDAKSSPDANYYSLLIVALLERGEPMTLEDVAVRFAAAGITSTADKALASLKRCKPARAPIYRDGRHYALDPHDDEVSFWLFRLGLRPARPFTRCDLILVPRSHQTTG